MGKIHVKNGTPVGSCSRCDSCMHAHVMEGYRETEVIVYCTYALDHPILVPFKVRECSNYTDKNRPTWEQMKDLALDIQPLTSAKSAGFRLPVKEEREIASDNEVITE
jgi:hypothetical protein